MWKMVIVKMKVTINDYDIGLTKADISSCIHETNAESKADTLKMKIKDPNRYWSNMQIASNDIIKVTSDFSKTGAMYIHRAVPKDDYFEILALSIPVSATQKKSMAWQSVRLFQLLKQKADELGLFISMYGIENFAYNYITQDDETDMSFISKICKREGYQMIVFDDRMIIYSESYIEGFKPNGTITVDQKHPIHDYDDSYKAYKSCKISGGGYSAFFTDKSLNTSSILTKTETYVESDSQALRYAKGYLRDSNKDLKHGDFTVQIDERYAAGSVCLLDASEMESGEKIFLKTVRYDYMNDSMKVFYRKIFLEGY